MRKTLVLVAVLYSAAAMAQTANPPATPPTVGGKPLVQVKPKNAAAKKDAAAKSATAKPQSLAGKLQACLEIDDATKERLNCYDAAIPPKPKAKQDPKSKAAAPKAVTGCAAIKEEDERLTCFNGFVEKLPKLPS